MTAPTTGSGRCTPVRPTTCAETSVPIASPPANVSIQSPEVTGLEVEPQLEIGRQIADGPEQGGSQHQSGQGDAG